MKTSEFLKQIQSKLPTWFRMRKDPSSIGAQFLNVMSLSFDDIQEILDTFYNNQYLYSSDISQVDIIYKAILPASISKDSNIKIKSESIFLEEATSLERFLTSLTTDKLNHYEIYYNNPYYIDYDKHLIYVRYPYQKSSSYPDGKINLYFYSSNEKLLFEQVLKLNIHQVWNSFDEFGILLNTPRLYGEVNLSYKKRLLDVFKHPGNSSKQGIYNHIGRSLKLSREKIWIDGSKDMILEEPRIYIHTVEVDGEKWDEDLTYIDIENRLVLLGNPLYEGKIRKINYISNLSIHELHDKDDVEFQQDLFDIDGIQKPMLEYYIDVIHKNIPIEWDRFLWGTGQWQDENTEIKDVTIPRFFDAKIDGWAFFDV